LLAEGACDSLVGGVGLAVNAVGIDLQQHNDAAPGANTTYLGAWLFREALTWCIEGFWRRRGLLVGVWVSDPAPITGVPCAFLSACRR
jgi:hypothetical protein